MKNTMKNNDTYLANREETMKNNDHNEKQWSNKWKKTMKANE